MITEKIKKFRHTKLWATTINLILIAIAINIIAGFIPLNIDLTSNKAHSLSKTTKKIVSNLDDIVTIKAFISSNLPPQLAPLKKTVENTLNQYQKTAKGKIKVIWVDPQKDSETENEAVSLGIVPFQFSSTEKDQFKVVQAYFGLAVLYAGDKQTIPAIQEINNLEYHLTATIKKMGQEKLPKVAFSQGLEETEPAKLNRIGQLLRLNYQLSIIDPSEETIDPEIKSLIIVGPKKEFSEKAKFNIDQFLMKGNGVVFLLDKIQIGDNLMAVEINNDLDDFLKHYGIEIESSLVVDSSAALTNFRTEQGAFIIPYPLWVKTRSENAAHDSPITASLESVVFPWISPLKLEKEAKPLWQSTPKSTTITDFTNLIPNRNWGLEQDDLEQFTLAAIQTNEIKSFFPKEEQEIEEFLEGPAPIKLAVVADANFIEDQTTISYPENAQFFLNLVDYVSADTELISIRSKTVFSRPLKQVEEKEKQIIKTIALASGPIILLILLLVVKLVRKKFNSKLND